MINYKNLILISLLASFIFSEQMGNYYNGAIPSYTKTPKKGKINLPSYFTSFGVISSLEAFLRAKKNTENHCFDWCFAKFFTFIPHLMK